MSSSGCDMAVSTAIDQGHFKSGDWPDFAWWVRFEDPMLTYLIESALSSSPTLHKAEERLKAARQGALQKKATLYPEVDFTASDSWQHLAKEGFFRAFAPTIPPVVNETSLGFSFSYEFDFWGKNRDLFRAALGIASAVEAEKRQAELILTTSIAYTYTELQFLLHKRQILQQMEHHLQDIEEMRSHRLEKGVDPSLLKLQSCVHRLDLQSSLVAVDRQIALDCHRLKALSGLGQNAPIEFVFRPLQPLVPALPKNLALDLLARRPDLAVQKARILAAAKEADAAKTDFYPNINLAGLVGIESIFASHLFRHTNYTGTITPAMHLPLFTAGKLKAHLREKVAQFNAAVHAYNELILQAAQEVADRLTSIALLQKQITLRQKSWQTSQEEATSAARRLEYALNDRIALLDAQNNALQSELCLIELNFAKQLEAILLIRALGGGYHE